MPLNSSSARAHLATLGAGIVNAAGMALQQVINETAKSAQSTDLFKDVTGGTRQSVHGDRNGLTGSVSAGGAAYFIENGTPPHEIEARGNALRFVMNGTVMFRKRVHHPGTAPRPFMLQARDEAERDLSYALEYFVGYAIAKA